MKLSIPGQTGTLQRSVYACALLLSALWLTGCASVRNVESEVQSYSTLTQLPKPPTYRLQLLPSQQAQTSLAGVGLQRDDAQGTLVAQIAAEARYIPDSWLLPGSPYAPYGPYGGFGWGAGFGWRGGMMWRDTGPSLHYRAVQLTLRDFQSQQVVYETSARYEDVWVDDKVIYRILFDSALNGFPKPSTGVRKVTATVGAPPAGNAAPAAVKP